ncbi:transposase family protein, partial [Sphaerimonospora mesophila]|uniref:transposase family protein n=1 Tax=Sphaerimonospora mesophila TaxID=37483 RepID=UPI001365E728
MQHPRHLAGDACFLKTLFPHLAELDVQTVADHGTYVLIKATTKRSVAACPGCGTLSSRIHGRYRRLLQDLPAGGRPLLIALTVRRLRCDNSSCRVRTFAEPLGGVARPHARATSPLRRMLELLALALAARAGARLMAMLGVTVSRDTLIRLIRALPDPEFGQV